MKQTFGMGYQSFREIRTENIFYIDKTGFIKEWWEYAETFAALNLVYFVL